MDAGIADTINRTDARRIAERMDEVDKAILPGMLLPKPWYRSSMAATLMEENNTSDLDRSWLVGSLSSTTVGLHFDGQPAQCDWDNLFSHLRAEILSRREAELGRREDTRQASNPQTPPAQAAVTQLGCVV